MKKEINREEYAARRAKIVEAMKEQSVLFMFAGKPKQRTTDNDYPFTPDRDYFYVTGIDLPGQILMITKSYGVVKEYLFVDRPDPRLELYHGHMDTDEEYKEGTGIENVFYLDAFDKMMGRLLTPNNLRKNDFEYLYMDYHKRDFNDVNYPENVMTKRLLEAYPYLQPRNIDRVIHNMRRVKTPLEIEYIRKAIDLTADGIRSITEHMKDGVNERELQAHFNFAIMSGGASDNGFDPIIAGGANNNVLHYCDNNQDIHDGDLLLLDLGAEYNYYSADISRTLPINGKFSELQAKYYEAVLYAQDKVLEVLRPGYEVEKTIDVARDAMYEKCKEYGFSHTREDMNHYLPYNGVCHFLGLDTHDVGDYGLLEAGMIVTLEPGLFFPEYGFGIRIEDDVLITEDGCEVLSAHIPKTIEEVEGICAAVKAARK